MAVAVSLYHPLVALDGVLAYLAYQLASDHWKEHWEIVALVSVVFTLALNIYIIRAVWKWATRRDTAATVWVDAEDGRAASSPLTEGTSGSTTG